MGSNNIYFEPEPLIEYLRGLGFKTDVEIGNYIGVNPKTVGQWRHGDRKIQFNVGDRVAVKLVGHPAFIWPEYWDMPMEDRNDRDKRRKREARAKARAEKEKQEV